MPFSQGRLPATQGAWAAQAAQASQATEDARAARRAEEEAWQWQCEPCEAWHCEACAALHCDAAALAYAPALASARRVGSLLVRIDGMVRDGVSLTGAFAFAGVYRWDGEGWSFTQRNIC